MPLPTRSAAVLALAVGAALAATPAAACYQHTFDACEPAPSAHRLEVNRKTGAAKVADKPSPADAQRAAKSVARGEFVVATDEHATETWKTTAKPSN